MVLCGGEGNGNGGKGEGEKEGGQVGGGKSDGKGKKGGPASVVVGAMLWPAFRDGSVAGRVLFCSLLLSRSLFPPFSLLPSPSLPVPLLRSPTSTISPTPSLVSSPAPSMLG